MASFAMASFARIRAVCNSKLWMPVFRGAFTTTAKNAQENAQSVPKFRMSLGYFGALAVSGFSLGTFTVAGGPVKGIAYSMNGNGEEIEYWPHENGTTICTPRDMKKRNKWVTGITRDMKDKAHEEINKYNGRPIQNKKEGFRIDRQGCTTNGYNKIQMQLNEIRQRNSPTTFAAVNHEDNVPIVHVRDGLHKSLEDEKLCELTELKEAEKPTVSDVNKQRYNRNTHKGKSKGK